MCNEISIPKKCEHNLPELLPKMGFQKVVENPDKSCFEVCLPDGWETGLNSVFRYFDDRKKRLRILVCFPDNPNLAFTFLFRAIEIVPSSRYILGPDGHLSLEEIYFLVIRDFDKEVLYASEKLVVPSGNPIEYNQAVSTCYTDAQNWAKVNYPDFECPVRSWDYFS